MKANEAPEKIYFSGQQQWSNPFIGLMQRCADTDIEYTRTDAFIEKALKFLDGCIPDYIDLKHANVDTLMDVDNERFINDFINYIKGNKV